VTAASCRRAEVEAALGVLAAAGVPAMSGWGYLAEAAAPAERQAALAAHPELADGVVLLSPDDLDRAEAALVGARLLPRAAVVAGASVLLLAVGTERPRSFLLPPNPAMFDEEAADQERSRAQARQEARGERLAELSGRGRADRELLARLRVWRQACPPGQLAQLAGEVDTAAAKAVAAARAAAEQRRRVDALAGEIDRLEQALLPALEQEAEAARDRAERLAALARREAERIAAQREAATLLARVEGHDAAAAHARSAADKEQELRGEALRAAESARSRAAALAEEAAKVHGGTEPNRADGGDEEGGATPAPALPELRVQYQAAEEAYRMVAVGEDLYAGLKAAEELEGAARGRLAGLAAPLCEAATRLLASPEGSDAASREAARAAAERQEAALRRRETGITRRLGALEQELEHNRPTGQNVWVVLPEEHTPHTVDQGRALLAAAQDEQRASNDALEGARGRQERLAKEHGKLQVETRELGNVRKALSELLAGVELPGVDDPAAAFLGSPEEAEARRASLRAALNEADTLLQQADQALQKAGDALVRFVGAERHEQLQSPARRQLLALGRDALAASANHWVDALAAREASLDQDLRELERHRRLIVERLAALCGSALATLHTAQRLSKLPHDLGDWSGQEFVRIRFADPELGALAVRVAEVLDQAAAEASGQTPNRGATARRDGIGLLLRAVRAAVPKGFAVDVLKPDAVLRTERLPVSRMASIFSGGQLLTAAIALYCMMAALRANERGQQRRSRHAGVLFLDNPIGRASAGYLLELQMAVARALGVQLVYTTGLLDLTALSVFPLLVRLRNDADLRAGMRYIAVDQHVRRALPEPYADGEEG
jgi:hypothetical protein